MHTLRKSNRKAVLGLVIALVLVLGVVGLVLADNFVNEVVTETNATWDPDTATIYLSSPDTNVVVKYKVNGTGGDGQGGCNASDGSPLYVTINVPPEVSASTTSLTFTACNAFQNVTFTSTTDGSYSISHTTSDSGVGTYNNAANFTLVVSGNTPADTTAPVISVTCNGDGCTDNWYTTDVDVDWTVSDPESSFTTTGCEDTTINTDTTGTTLSCSATSAGGPAGPVSVTIIRDATAPIVTVDPARDPDYSDWYNAPVDFDTAGTDATSGVDDANCTTDQTYSGPDGTDLVVSGTCTDNAGNVGYGTSKPFDFDDTNPTLTWNGGPAAGETYYFGFVPAEPTCTASDDTSGPDTCGVSGYSNAIGSHTMTASAYDIAGNSYSEYRSYSVSAWTLRGFFHPVDMSGIVNTVKNGSTVPLKFEIFAGTTELTSIDAVATFKTQRIDCDTATAQQDAIEVTTTGATVLRYDATGGQFIQNWQTPRGSSYVGACYQAMMTADDGSSLVAYFKLK